MTASDPSEIGVLPTGHEPLGGEWSTTSIWRSMFIFFMQPMLLGCWLVYIPEVKEALDLSNTSLALGLIGMPIGTLVTLPFAGRLYAKAGARKGLLFGLPAFITGMCLIGLMPTLPALFAGLFVAGSMMAFTELGMNLAATHIEKQSGRMFMNRAHGFWSVGIMTGSLIGVGFAKADASLFVASLAIGVPLVLATYVAVSPLPQTDPPIVEDADSRPASFHRPPLILVGIAAYMFGVTFIEGAVADWIAIYLRQLMNPDAAEAGLGFSVFAACVSIARFVGDWFKQRLGQVLLARLLCVLSLIGAVLLIGWSNVNLIFVSLVLLGFGASVGFPLGISAASLLPGQTSVHLSFLTSVALAGFLVGPPVIGFIADHFSLRAAFAILIPLQLISLACTGSLRVKKN